MTIPGMIMNFDFSKIDWSTPMCATTPIAPTAVFPSNAKVEETPSNSTTSTNSKSTQKTVEKNTVKYGKELLKQVKGLDNQQKQLLNELLSEYVDKDAPRLSKTDFAIMQKIIFEYVNNPEFTLDAKSLETLVTIANKDSYKGSKPVDEQQQEAEEKVQKSQKREKAVAQYPKDIVIDSVDAQNIAASAGLTVNDSGYIESQKSYDEKSHCINRLQKDAKAYMKALKEDLKSQVEGNGQTWTAEMEKAANDVITNLMPRDKADGIAANIVFANSTNDEICDDGTIVDNHNSRDFYGLDKVGNWFDTESKTIIDTTGLAEKFVEDFKKKCLENAQKIDDSYNPESDS